MSKDSVAFWKAWKGKFGITADHFTVDNSTDIKTILANFARYFESVNCPVVNDRERELSSEYRSQRARSNEDIFVPALVDADLVARMIEKLKRGKAVGPDDISSEYLKFSHPILACILAKLFGWMVRILHVPNVFCQSITDLSRRVAIL